MRPPSRVVYKWEKVFPLLLLKPKISFTTLPVNFSYVVVVNTYLVGHQDFLRFLGSKLTVGKATSSDEIDTALRAHKLMAALITKNWKHLGYTVCH